MDGYTFFKTPEGHLYGVSDRVMDAGYTPKDGVFLATKEEIEEFKGRIGRPISSTTEEERLSLAQKMLKSKIFLPEMIKRLTEAPHG